MKYNKNEVTGKMRDRIILQNVNRSRSLTGFASEIWADTATIWAFAESKLPGSNETIIEGKNTAKNICDFTIRYISSITEESRVVFKNKIYQVKNIKISHDRRFISFQGVYYDSYSTIFGLQSCSASLLAQNSLSAALMRVIKYQSSLNAFGSVTADINFVHKVASSLNANALLVSDINFVHKAQASLLTSASVTGDIIIPKLVQASLTGAGTTAADLTVTAAASLLLDLYPNAAAAYSLRKLRTAYTGSAIRVRRSSDNTEQNIGFDVNGNLDTTALTTFVGVSNGFVTTWYDQSGNARDATQTTQANQPQIVSNGSVLTTNNKPSLLFNSSHLFLNSALFSGANPRTILSVYKPNNSSGNFVYSIFGQSFNGSNGGYTVLQSRTQFVVGDPYFAGFSQDLGNGLTTPNILQKLAQFNYNGTTGYLYKNNTLIQSANITLNAQSTGLIYIGVANFNGTITEHLVGNLQECIAWASNQNANTSGISNNINTHYGIY